MPCPLRRKPARPQTPSTNRAMRRRPLSPSSSQRRKRVVETPPADPVTFRSHLEEHSVRKNLFHPPLGASHAGGASAASSMSDEDRNPRSAAQPIPSTFIGNIVPRTSSPYYRMEDEAVSNNNMHRHYFAHQQRRRHHHTHQSSSWKPLQQRSAPPVTQRRDEYSSSYTQMQHLRHDIAPLINSHSSDTDNNSRASIASTKTQQAEFEYQLASEKYARALERYRSNNKEVDVSSTSVTPKHGVANRSRRDSEPQRQSPSSDSHSSTSVLNPPQPTLGSCSKPTTRSFFPEKHGETPLSTKVGDENRSSDENEDASPTVRRVLHSMQTIMDRHERRIADLERENYELKQRRQGSTNNQLSPRTAEFYHGTTSTQPSSYSSHEPYSSSTSGLSPTSVGREPSPRGGVRCSRRGYHRPYPEGHRRHSASAGTNASPYQPFTGASPGTQFVDDLSLSMDLDLDPSYRNELSHILDKHWEQVEELRYLQQQQQHLNSSHRSWR